MEITFKRPLMRYTTISPNGVEENTRAYHNRSQIIIRPETIDGEDEKTTNRRVEDAETQVRRFLEDNNVQPFTHKEGYPDNYRMTNY
jgi:hypothetical protein